MGCINQSFIFLALLLKTSHPFVAMVLERREYGTYGCITTSTSSYAVITGTMVPVHVRIVDLRMVLTATSGVVHRYRYYVPRKCTLTEGCLPLSQLV